MDNKEAIKELVDYIADEHKLTISFEAITQARNALEEIQQYKQLEEQGLLLKLPCPLGTKIYCIHNGFVEEGMFFEMSCFKFKDYYKKSWFLTREEAEQALKQMGE